MNRSDTLFTAAKKVLPGGVNSPVRAFQRVGGHPIFFNKSTYKLDSKSLATTNFNQFGKPGNMS